MVGERSTFSSICNGYTTGAAKPSDPSIPRKKDCQACSPSATRLFNCSLKMKYMNEQSFAITPYVLSAQSRAQMRAQLRLLSAVTLSLRTLAEIAAFPGPALSPYSEPRYGQKFQASLPCYLFTHFFFFFFSTHIK